MKYPLFAPAYSKGKESVKIRITRNVCMPAYLIEVTLFPVR